jgi:uncharacterized protein DUF4384
LPFNADSTDQQIELQRAGVEEKLRELRAELSESARAVILKAIAFEVSDRYRAACEFSEAFDRALAEPDRLALVQTTQGAPEIRLPAAPRRRRPPLIAALIAALIALSAAAAVGTVAWRRLGPSRPGTPVGAGANSPAPAERSLSYSLEARKNPKRYPGNQPFTPPIDSVFKAGDQVRLRLSGQQAGYLYVINEGPERANDLPDFVVMFPYAGGSAQVAANQQILIPTPSDNPETDWFEFNEELGVEKIWLIWSERSVAEMEAIKDLANQQDSGLVSDPDQIRRVAMYLKAIAETGAEVEKDEMGRWMKLKGKGAVLAWMMRLEHR